MATITDQPAGIIVKSDQTGRTRYTPEYKREVLAAFESSSLSAPRERSGLPPSPRRLFRCLGFEETAEALSIAF